MADVVHLQLVDVGEATEIPPEDIFDQFEEGHFKEVVVIGLTPEGELEVFSTKGVCEAAFLLDRGKLWLLEVASGRRAI